MSFESSVEAVVKALSHTGDLTEQAVSMVFMSNSTYIACETRMIFTYPVRLPAPARAPVPLKDSELSTKQSETASMALYPRS